MLTNEEASFSSSDEEIQVSSDEDISAVSPSDADGDNILSVDLRRGEVNNVPFPEGKGK